MAKPRTAAPKPDAPGENTFYRHEHVGADMADEICRRLKLANSERETIVNLVGNHMFWYTPEWSDGTVRRFISRVGVEQLDGLFALRAGDVRARGHDEEPGVEIDELKARVAARDRQGRGAQGHRSRRRRRRRHGGARRASPGASSATCCARLLERVLDDAALNTREHACARSFPRWRRES